MEDTITIEGHQEGNQMLKQGDEIILELNKSGEVEFQAKVIEVYWIHGLALPNALLVEVMGLPDNSEHVLSNKGAHYLVPWHSILSIRVHKRAAKDYSHEGGCV